MLTVDIYGYIAAAGLFFLAAATLVSRHMQRIADILRLGAALLAFILRTSLTFTFSHLACRLLFGGTQTILFLDLLSILISLQASRFFIRLTLRFLLLNFK
jgi:hypothetical protein